MRVEIGDHTYFVVFHTTNHGPDGMELRAKYKHSHGYMKGLVKYFTVSHTTTCIIKRAETRFNQSSKHAELILSVDTHCSTKDKFDLHEGRRRALKQALRELNTPYVLYDEKLFWQAFVKTLPKRPPTVKQLKKEIFKLNERVKGLLNLADSVALDLTTQFNRLS